MLRWLKSTIKKMIFPPYLMVRRMLGTFFSAYLNKYTPLQIGEIAALNKTTQLLLSMKYKSAVPSAEQLRISFKDCFYDFRL